MIIIMRARRVCVYGAHYAREGASSQYCDIRYSVMRALRGTKCGYDTSADQDPSIYMVSCLRDGLKFLPKAPS